MAISARNRIGGTAREVKTGEPAHMSASISAAIFMASSITYEAVVSGTADWAISIVNPNRTFDWGMRPVMLQPAISLFWP